MSLIEIRDLHVSYGSILALKGVSLCVEQGSIVSVIGANGAGKTTLLRAISGELPKRAGQIVFDGKDITRFGTDKIVKMGIIQVPEGRQVFGEMTVLENLRAGAYCRPKSAELNADLERIYSLFPILEQRKNQKGGSLSGGEQQMLALGRALMSKPKVLLLDEPSMGIAPLVTREIFRTIRQISRDGVTIVLIEQDAKLALKVSQYAYVMETGMLVKEGKSSVLATDSDIKKIYLGG